MGCDRPGDSSEEGPRARRWRPGGRKPPTQGPGLPNSWLLLLTLGLLLPAVGAGDISCQGIRYIYFNRGLDTRDIPRSPQQGRLTGRYPDPRTDMVTGASRERWSTVPGPARAYTRGN
jgi:hypothetical protein